MVALSFNAVKRTAQPHQAAICVSAGAIFRPSLLGAIMSDLPQVGIWV